MTMRARFPLLLLGLVFLASVSVSFAIAYWEQENPNYNKCIQSCNREKDEYRHEACHARCKLVREEKQHDHERRGEHPRPQPRHEEEEEDEQREREQPRPHHPHQREHEHDREHEDEEQQEREPRRPFPRPHRPHRREHEHEHEEQEEEQEDESESQRQNNPFHFSSNRFRTFFKNQHGRIRVLQRFEQRSRQLQNLREYRILEFKSKPNTLLLPSHADADLLLLVLNGRAILTFVNSDERDSYNLERGDAQRIPAGTTYYVVNPDDKETLNVITLAIPVNNPETVQSFFLSSTEDQESYLKGFSENTLEAAFDKKFEEINRVLFGEEGHKRGEQRQQEGVIVEVSKEHIRELSKHAKSSSKKTISSEDKPFNLRSRDPTYSSKFGKLYEITPEKNPQLRDLDLFLSYVEIKEGGLMLPHYNSKASVILAISEGEANIELVGLKQQQQQRQQEEQEGPREVRRYRSELSEGDLFIIPSSYPVAVNATSNLKFYAFGINAENNQRNFLAGEKDNVLRQLHRQVEELAFPGSAEDVEKLIQKQKESYFVDAQPQLEQEGRKERKGPLSSILNAFF